MKTKLCFLCAPVLFGIVCAGSSAQYAVGWHKIAGSGGASTNGQYTVSGTIGQHDAGGPMTNGNLSLTGGFWSITALPTPGSPLLSIHLTSMNTAIVSWPSPSTGFVLQQNGDLSTTNWVASLETTSDDSTNKFIIVSPPAGTRFYRLSKP